MKHLIIETKNLSKEIPKYQTWYRLHDILFVSVINTENSNRKSHFRRKSKSNVNQKKTDNDMCLWHSDWQFVKIESIYGTGNSKNKTYEIVVKHNEETHRIDSLVENLAIEFQHTLSVSINEMDSRFLAHKSLGYQPYLVLDFTEYSAESTILKCKRFDYRKIDDYLQSNSVLLSKFLKQVKKWLTSKYFINNNLFCDFSDYIVRLIPNGANTFYKYEQNFFLSHLLELDGVLTKDEENEKNLIQEKKEEEKRKLIIAKKQEREDKINRNKEEVIESKEYHYYRKCIKNEYINKEISKIKEPEYISCFIKKGEYFGYNRNIYIYRIHPKLYHKPLLEIHYITLGSYENKEYTFLQSEIDIIKQTGENNIGIRRMSFRQKPMQPIKLISIRNELAKGYLHSFNDYALYLYDENEKNVRKEYYLFNQAVTKSILSELSDYFLTLGYNKISSEANLILDSINMQNESGINFMNYVIQNYLPEEILKEYYKTFDEPMPFENSIY